MAVICPASSALKRFSSAGVNGLWAPVASQLVNKIATSNPGRTNLKRMRAPCILLMMPEEIGTASGDLEDDAVRKLFSGTGKWGGASIVGRKRGRGPSTSLERPDLSLGLGAKGVGVVSRRLANDFAYIALVPGATAERQRV